MKALLTPRQRAFLATAGLALLSAQVPSCDGSSQPSSGGHDSIGGAGAGQSSTNVVASGGTLVTGGTSTAGGSSTVSATGASSGTGGTSLSVDTLSSTIRSSGGTQTTERTAIGGNESMGGSANHVGGADTSSGGMNSTGGATGGTSAAGSSTDYVVSLIQSSRANASEITQDDIVSMVTEAVTRAGGLDFIRDGMTVVLKPNLLTPLQQCWFGSANNPATVNGVTTDWRVVKAVADLVRQKNPAGKILVMEGSARSTTAAFTAMGYTSSNFGASVDEFIALEGTACGSKDSTGLVQKTGKSGAQYWINQRYFEADVLISIPTLKTHSQAGITGAVKNLGIGSTPAAKYSASTSSADCGRNQSSPGVSSYIEHTLSGLGNFVSDFYSVRPPDFAVMDGLQGLQNGPCSSSSADRMNMRLVLASKNAVALDTVQSAVMNCTASKVPYLTKLEGWGLGTTDIGKISVVGNKQIADVKKSFKGGASGVCN